MHVGLIIYGSLDTLSGGYLYDRVIVEHLQRSGDTVDVVSLPWRNYASHLADNFSATLLDRLRRTPFDVLMQDELNHPSLAWLNARIRRDTRYPIVSIVHHLRSSELRAGWQNAFYREVERRYLRTVDAFIFNSQTTQSVVEGLIGAERLHVVAHPAGDRLGATLGEGEIAARAREAGPLRLFFLGNVIPRKGLHVLLDALARLPAGMCELVAAGNLAVDQAYTQHIQHQIERLGLARSVTLPGPLAGETLIDHFTHSHVLVIPSSYEGFGIAYLEGMAFGLPGIASTSGAAGEVITHGQDGLLIPPGDSVALAEHLKLLAVDRHRLITLSLAARERFEAHPTWEQTAESVRRFLHEISGRV